MQVGTDFDIKDGKKASFRFNPLEKVSFEIGIDDNNKSDSVTTAKINYNFLATENNFPEKLVSDKMFEHTDQTKNVYDMVRRQNRIVKTVSGSVTVGRGT